MRVFVYKESVTEIKGMDAITTGTIERLRHGGGVGYYISKAAGKKMDQDCNSNVSRNGPLEVTQNYVSIPGDMKCKGIIHAVGPTWSDYKDKKKDCANDLYETIKNVLIKASSKKWQKVALPAISSGLFGVPKKLCAEMYIKAFADYATEADGHACCPDPKHFRRDREPQLKQKPPIC
ncbi:macro domain-containing protein lmo2759-like [Mercenaria mercenaria]|uniref:macro domain-containing protein lmo2759-like n=1 Tax=Mercenaria mercenaria TaxID=6596 RepID=UPI00234EB84E|nr:macro domain-containing protein lmo2759-like [Mercenaria mercenaria]